MIENLEILVSAKFETIAIDELIAATRDASRAFDRVTQAALALKDEFTVSVASI